MMAHPSVAILHTGGHYPRLVEEYLRSQGAEVTAYELSVDPAEAVDDPQQYLPPKLGETEVLIAVALPAGIITALPRLLTGTNCRALIVPVEDPGWVRPGLERQLHGMCKEVGIECAVPMPFCALTGTGEVIRAFCDDYRVGRPRVELEIADGVVTEARCLRSAPCGLTQWVVGQLAGTSVDEVIQRAQTLHHGRPCMASMALLRGLGDTLMHVSLDILKRTFNSALRRAQGGSVVCRRP